MPLQNADGSLNVTLLLEAPGTPVSAFNRNGSLNVIAAPNPVTRPVGVYHPSGAWYVTFVDGSTNTGVYASDGSLNVTQAGAQGVTHPCGAMRVRVVA
jgi:hypothetical protein